MGAAASIDNQVNFSTEDLISLKFIETIPNCHHKTLAIYSSNFPAVLNERVLNFILKQIDAAENYTLVYFHSGINNRPSFSWISEAYKMIDYHHRKKLGHLYWGFGEKILD